MFSKPVPPLAVWAAESMMSEPMTWTFDEHYAVHIGGAKVWIANGAWAVEVIFPRIGKIGLKHGAGLRPLRPQRAIWKAVKYAKAFQTQAALDAYKADVAQRALPAP